MDEHYLVQTFNHILFDGWSLGVLFGQWFNDYLALLAGRVPALEINRFEPLPPMCARTAMILRRGPSGQTICGMRRSINACR